MMVSEVSADLSSFPGNIPREARAPLRSGIELGIWLYFSSQVAYYGLGMKCPLNVESLVPNWWV